MVSDARREGDCNISAHNFSRRDMSQGKSGSRADRGARESPVAEEVATGLRESAA
jgi:hypothetical protein